MWIKKEFAHDPKQEFKKGGGSVMVWACMAATGTDSLIFIDVTRDGSRDLQRNVCSL